MSCYRLKDAVMADVMDFHPAVYADYGFMNCNSAERQALFGVYTCIIKICECDMGELHNACINNRLAEFITSEYERVFGDKPARPGSYRDWFNNNKKKVRNFY